VGARRRVTESDGQVRELCLWVGVGGYVGLSVSLIFRRGPWVHAGV